MAVMSRLILLAFQESLGEVNHLETSLLPVPYISLVACPDPENMIDASNLTYTTLVSYQARGERERERESEQHPASFLLLHRQGQTD
ncbi:hypothetical protein F5X96DRAFT_641366 [Biscogniauxia mediterranea]|nr:hypothetical protein F5X96DRAFT_641366 [Biscogniauxia mediterranea]